MKEWQGPAIWIYNDAVFSEHDIDSLLKLCVGGKMGKGYPKIGKFGIGFNSCFHLTDLPSFVSGKYILFLDPLDEFIPEGGKLNFLDDDNKDFLSSDHIKSYLGIEGCNFKEEFNGTLFRLPLRVEESGICDDILSTNDVLEFLGKLNQDAFAGLLFLHHVESFEVMLLEKDSSPKKAKSLWEVKLTNMNDELRGKRCSADEGAKIVPLEIEMIDGNETGTQSWMICAGGMEKINEKGLKSFASKHGMNARGGVAALHQKNIKERDDYIAFYLCNQLRYQFI